MKMHLKRKRFSGGIKNSLVIILLVLLILPIYSNTFHAEWQFDDKPNIVKNVRLHLTDFSPASLWKTFYAKAGTDAFFRPLSSLSLALNWYAGQSRTFGYHLVNLVIHILTAFILFLAIKNLLQAPNLKKRYDEEDIHFIALLSAVLWAVNPIQTQAVTYIVQRMASMAAMFYILGIYFYIKGRSTAPGNTRVMFFIGCFSSFVWALMSKENAAMLPASLLLVEVMFFRHFRVIQQLRRHLTALLGIGVVIILLGMVLFRTGTLDFLFDDYATRPFSLWERILTEPKIVLFYISQIFYPLPARLSITHDVIISKSLFSPWTTLPAILIIVLLVCIAVLQSRKRPIAAFAILFFFLNHVIESTFLPLELVFEHRNYLPSFFLFLPIACALRFLFNFYKVKNRPLYAIMTGFVILVIIGMGCFTYIRNRDWSTEASLWHDAMKKAPRDSRPLWGLAIQLAWAPNPSQLQYEVALAMFKKAMTLNMAHDFLVTDIMNNIGMIHYKSGEYQKAVDTYEKGLKINPGFLKMRYDLISSLIMMGKWEEGSKEADRLIANQRNYVKPDYFKLKGFILLWQDQPEQALAFFRKALEMEPDNKAVLLNIGVALSMVGEHNAADGYLKKVAAMASEDIRPFYALIENSIRAGDLPKAEHYAELMFAEFSIQSIIDGFDILTENYQTAPMSADIIIPVVKKTMMRLTGELEALSRTANTE